MEKKKLTTILFIFVIGITISLFSQDNGVVVEEVGEHSAGERAGIQKGDILFSWERPANPPANPEPARGVIESVFDFMMVEIEQGPRGLAKLTGERESEKVIYEIPVGEWKIKVRPLMGEGDLQIYLKGKKMIEDREVETGITIWKELMQSERAARDGLFSSWMHLQIGNALVKQRKWDEAHSAYQDALEQAKKSQNPSAQDAVWDALSKNFQKQNDFQKAGEMYESSKKIWEETLGESLSLAMSLNNIGLMAYYRGNLEKAEIFHKRALEIREKLAPDSLDVASSFNNLGLVESKRGKIKDAESYYVRAFALNEKLAPISLSTAVCLNNLSIISYRKGKLEKAEDYQKRALSIREKIAPDSLDVAMSLNNLGVFAQRRGDLTLAEDYHNRSLAIKEKLAPGSIDVAYSLTNLGTIAQKRGDLRTAQMFHKQALAIREKIAPGSLEMTASLNNLGVIAGDRGYLEVAESYHRQALAIREKLAPDSFLLASSLTNLGVVARLQGNLETAESCQKRSLAILEKLIPGSFHVAGLLSNLGSVAQDKGDLEAAEAYYQRSLAIREKLVPGSFDLAASLNNLGVIAHKRGDLEKAKDYHEQALAIREKLAPESLEVATSLNNLGRVAKDRRELDRAESHLLDALVIWKKCIPGNINEANTLHELGLLYHKKNKLKKAKDYFHRSLESLEIQISRLGGSQEIKAGFRAKYGHYYQDYIELLIKMKKHEEAFHTLEESRAQLFLAMLAERDLVFTADIPKELEKERKRTAWEYDQVQEKLRQLNPEKDQDKIERLLTRLRELRNDQASIAEKIRKTSPRFSSLQYPQPLDLPGVQSVLDPGTVMLSYSLGDEKNYLFVVTAESGFWIHVLSIEEANLRDEVETFRRLIQKGKAGFPIQESLVTKGKRLYAILIQPASQVIEKSEKVLIIPDGPLHALPFGALVRNYETEELVSKTSGRSWQYLIEWKPLHIVVSATVYGELKKRRKAYEAKKEGKILMGFGDPEYPSLEVARREDLKDAVVRSVVRRGYDFRSLPATRQEVSTIAGIYGEQVDIYLGDEATEQRAKAAGKELRYIHFACHGFLNERFPLNSGLALTIPPKPKEGEDNGILQAWEIFERMRVDADLITLSACETGLGKEMGGEGLIGLTRAFQYAGARSVLASLWEVADITTAELMKQFYGYLKKGLSKDEALRKAQMDMIRKSIEIKSQKGKTREMDASHPFFWAAFQLFGDCL